MIHGTKRSKKVPTLEEKEADAALSIKIRDSLHEFISIRNQEKTDIPYLIQFTEILMELCSDISTIYNFRRELIDAQLSKLDDPLQKMKILGDNLKMVTKLMKSDPKSYNIWNFRKWLVIKLFQLSNSNDIVQKEEDLCKMMLTRDQKNFHVWNYRNWLHQLHLDVDKALEFTHEKIKSNPFNFSPLHFRTKHFTQKYEQFIIREESPEVLHYGMPLVSFKQELEMMKTALFLNPNQEAPWQYYKWLLNLIMPCSIISITRVSDLSYQLVTNSLIDNLNQQNFKIVAESEITSGFIVKSKTDKLPSNQWILTFDKVPAIEPTIEVMSNFQYKLSYVKPEYGWFFIGTSKPKEKIQASKTIILEEIKFVNELLESQNHKCRYASQCLLDLYQMTLFFCQTRSAWREIFKDVNNVLESLSGQVKGRKYIQKITEHWRALEEGDVSKLRKQETILLSQLVE